jgi:hypothetical protein
MRKNEYVLRLHIRMHNPFAMENLECSADMRGKVEFEFPSHFRTEDLGAQEVGEVPESELNDERRFDFWTDFYKCNSQQIDNTAARFLFSHYANFLEEGTQNKWTTA